MTELAHHRQHQHTAKWRLLFGWTAKFTEDWGSLPATPIIYLSLLAGTIHVIVTDPHPGGPEDVVDQWWASVAWRVLGILAPILAIVAGKLICKFSGQVRLFGLWLRLAGDVGQFIAILALMLGRVLQDEGLYDDPRVYFTYALFGVLGFIGMLVIRDVWILFQVEEITRELDQLAKRSGE